LLRAFGHAARFADQLKGDGVKLPMKLFGIDGNAPPGLFINR